MTSSGTFRLAVVIVKTASAVRQPDPVIYIAGGPGSPLTARAAMIARHEADIVAPDRDLILVDQRAAGRSEPALCPDLARKQLAIFAAGADEPALVRAWRDSYGECRREMDAVQLRPEWFGTPVSAADYEAVRLALGIERWNIYALSYGTAVAMTIMAQLPDSLRSAVLDSVFPPDPLPDQLPQTFDRALGMLFTACQQDPACARRHPDLRASFEGAVQTLDATPLPIPLPPGTGPAVFQLRAEVFRLIVNRALYSRTGMAALPAFIEAARDRQSGELAETVAAVVRGYADMSLGDMAAVECRDRPSWRSPSRADLVVPPVSAFVPGLCDGWSQPGPSPSVAVHTSVPTLVLSGQADPITPPSFAHQAAAELGERAKLVEFAHVGHGAQQASPCGEQLVTAFLRDPAAPLETSCAGQVAPVTFR